MFTVDGAGCLGRGCGEGGGVAVKRGGRGCGEGGPDGNGLVGVADSVAFILKELPTRGTSLRK